MDSIEMLYKTYSKDVLNYLIGLTRDVNVAEDLLSETFYSAMITLPSYRGECHVKTWLFTIARHKWLDELRKKRPMESIDLIEIYLQDSSQTLEQRMIMTQVVKRVKELLAVKDSRTQKIMSMRIDGYSYSEIAQTVGISEGSARVIEFRTKTEIKKQLKKEDLYEV